MDPGALDQLVHEKIVRVFDHKNLNEEIEAFEHVVPTSENLGLLIHRRLKQGWTDVFPGGGPSLKKFVSPRRSGTSLKSMATMKLKT